MKNLKNNKMLLGIGITFLVLATISMSYAWFSATVTPKNEHDQIVTTGTLELTYTDGKEIVMNNIRPGATLTKEVSVKNTGTLDAEYNLVWQELINQIQNDEMVMTIACERQTAEGQKQENCEGLDSETPISKPIILKQIGIEAGITHKYTITITFKETNANQNYNQGKNFTGTVGVNEYKEPTPVYCTTDKELTQGTEFVKGPYTYHYMEELTKQAPPISSNGENIKPSMMSSKAKQMAYNGTLIWEQIYDADEGWGVAITDITKTDPITEAPCTYINDIPVISMSYMFAGSEATEIDVSGFYTNNITDMSAMFDSTKAPVLDVSNFNTSKVTGMGGMFSNTAVTTLDLSNFDTSNVTDMTAMFSTTALSSIDLSSFDTSNVTSMYSMFRRTTAKKINMKSFNTSKVSSMSYMFANMDASQLDLSNFDTNYVEDMSGMFWENSATTLDLSSFKTTNVSDIRYMFYQCPNLKTIYASTNFTTSSVRQGYMMFYEVTNLVGGAGTTYDKNNDSYAYAHIDGGTANPGYFTEKTN